VRFVIFRCITASDVALLRTECKINSLLLA